MISQQIKSLPELHQAVSKLDRNGLWLFRGQSESSWSLIPSMYRDVDKLNPPYDEDDAEWITRIERDVYRTFDQRAHVYDHKNNAWERLALAQHYGTPTRLLDWTRSSSIAAYFAVAKVKSEPAAVWCLDIQSYPFPEFLGRITKSYAHRLDVLSSISAKRQPSFFQEVSKPFVGSASRAPKSKPLIPDPVLERDEGFLVVLDPPHFDERMKAQQGLLTFYYSFDDYDLVWDLKQYIEQIEQSVGKTILVKFEISSNSRVDVLADLERNENLNWHRLFPDLVGLGQWLSIDRDTQFKTEIGDR